MNDFLANLKPGDRVLVVGRTLVGSGIATVDRLTKTQIILSNKQKYRRSTGRLIGADAWNFYTLEEATDERVGKIRDAKERNNRISILGQYRWADLSLEQLRAVCDALPKR